MVWQRTGNQRISSSEVYPKRLPKESIRALHLVQRFKPSWEGNLPVSSRITVKRITQVSLTAGFEMRPGVSPPLWPSNHFYSENDHICNLFNDWTSKWAFSSYRLNMSPKLHAYTLALSNESSIRALWCLVLGWASCLDAFSIYLLKRGCPALPCQTTGKLVASDPCSSRTKGSFPSSINASRR